MKIPIPKRLRSSQCERLFCINMNDFDVEMLLPAIFYSIRTGGKERGERTDPKPIQKYIDFLATHVNLDGFSDSEGKKLLGKWVRTSTIATGKIGLAKIGEQIMYIKPLSFLSYKPGFPAERARLRNVDKFFSTVFRDFIHSEGSQIFEPIFKDAFSRGVSLPESPDYPGKYDGNTILDTETLLLLYFMDGFTTCKAKYGSGNTSSQPSCKIAAHNIAEDITLFMAAYRELVPTQVLLTYIVTLISFELFIYTMKLIRAVNVFFEQSILPVELGGNNIKYSLDLYVDMTRTRGCSSDTLAISCVNRDVEELRRYFVNALKVRMLDSYVSNSPRLKERSPERESPEFLDFLLNLKNKDEVEVRAERDWEEIVKYWEEETFELPEDIKNQIDSMGSTFDKIIRILEKSQESDAITHYVRWFWAVGGLTKPYGLLSGNLRGKRVWRYAMSDMLLETLIQLFAVLRPIAVDNKKYHWNKHYSSADKLDMLTPVYHEDGQFIPLSPQPFPIRDFIAFLYERYGILIDRPPHDMADTQTLNAASENMKALKDRLRNMGVFQDLSDDFTAQVITPYYIEKIEEK